MRANNKPYHTIFCGNISVNLELIKIGTITKGESEY